MKTLEEMSVLELKATVYDQLAILEQTQKNLQILNSRIAELSKKESEAKTE